MTKLLISTCVVALFLFARVEAIIVTPFTFDELVARSTAVVYARVAEVRGQWSDDRRSISSVITLEPLRYMKGDLGSNLVMRLPGGAVGGIVNVLPGAPVLRPGELIVVFLSSRGPSIPTALGLGQGIFRVFHDARSGSTLVSPPPLKSSPAGRVIRGAADRRALTLDAFTSSVRELGAAR